MKDAQNLHSREALLQRIRQAFYTMIWLMVITFPLMIMRDDTVNDEILWRWGRLAGVGVFGFILSYLWYWAMDRKQGGVSKNTVLERLRKRVSGYAADRQVRLASFAVLGVLLAAYPFLVSLYNTSIMATALIYIVLGLGLNIIIGWGGLLNLGYAAFFLAGAYTYALLYKYFGIGFWVALPLGGTVSALIGILVGIPVLRLRGDYLAIVTLAFAEMVRIVLNNMGDFSGGPDGISRIPRPGLFGIDLNLQGSITLTYFIALGAVVLTVLIMRRVENSRWGRAWEAMKEDETAAEAMGVDITHAKLTTFAMGSFFAGIAGVIMAGKTTKVTPDSFGLMESVMILSIVVLGGMGSIPGVIVGALMLKLLPEYFRAFSEYRMLIFGLVLVLMMVFKPSGIISKIRKTFTLENPDAALRAAPSHIDEEAVDITAGEDEHE